MSTGREIVFVAGKDPLTQVGGHPTFVRAHGRAAIAAGYSPHVFCASPEAGNVETDFGVLHRMRMRWPSYRQTMIPFLAPTLTHAIVRFLRERSGPHLIHGFSTWGVVAVDACARLRRLGHEAIPIVNAYTTMRHESWAKVLGLEQACTKPQRARVWCEYFWIRTVIRVYERRAFERARLVLVNYDSVRQIIAAEYSSQIRFRKVPYAPESAFRFRDQPVELPMPDELGALQPADALLIVAVSRHDLRKGIPVLLRALARLQADGVPFRACLVGPGELIEEHRRLAAALHLGEAILMTGAVPDPLAYLKQADIFVLPSLEEGSGSVSLLEALQLGVAVVASAVDGILEDVTPEKSALLVRPGDAGELASALRRLLEDGELRDRLAGSGREVFQERFGADNLAGALRAIYEELGFS